MSAATHDHSARPVRSDVLLLRVWLDPTADEAVRARLLTRAPGSAHTTSLAAAEGVDDICAVVRRWLQEIEQ